MCVGLEPHVGKVVHIGGLSRFDLAPRRRVTAGPGASRPRELLVVSGTGNDNTDSRGDGLAAAVESLGGPGWRVRRRGRGCWVDDPWPDLCAADVVVTHAGLGAISDVAAARKPAVVVPERRPHDEQAHTAAALSACGLALVLDGPPRDWSSILETALTINPAQWSTWSHGQATSRFADLIVELAVRPAC